MDLDGIPLHYIDEGQGDPVVMVHGNPTWSFYFRRLTGALKSSHRVIVPDHVGCGLSGKPGDDRYSYTLSSRVNDLEVLLSHLKIEKNITLVLHDWGGMIGMTYASRHPGAISRLVVMNTSAFRLPAAKGFPLPLWLCRNTPLGGFLVRGLNAFCLGAAAFCCTKRPLAGGIRRGYLYPYDSWHNRVAVHRFVQDIPLEPGDPSYAVVTEVEEGLGRFRDVPMLLLWGEKDFVFDRHFLKGWMERFPGAKVHSFPQAGHYVLEDEAEAIIPLVEEFLKDNPLKR